jgi:hypothetical protein
LPKREDYKAGKNAALRNMDLEFRPVIRAFDPAIRLAPSGDRFATVHVAPLHCRYSSVADVHLSTLRSDQAECVL